MITEPPQDRASSAPPGARFPGSGHEIPVRTQDAIPLVNPTPLVGFTLPWQVQPGRDVRVVVIKGTFDLVPGEPARPRAESDLPSGDVHEGGEPMRSLLYPTDFAIFKPKADVTLTGHAYAPGGSSPAARVAFRFGRRSNGFDRMIAVFGERRWQGTMKLAPTEPRSFEKIPLVYERAFGGAGFDDNPVGLGRSGALLPNLEEPAHLLRSPTDTPRPAGFGAVPVMWQARQAKLGTYGAEWHRSRWPYFPDDFDWTFFQAAPPAQQLAYLDGDEPFELVGMHPEHPMLGGRLPGVRARCFAQKTTEAGGAFHEVVLRLDTVTFDVDAMKVNLVWRGILDVRDDDASDVAELFVMMEPPDRSGYGMDAGRAITLIEARERYELAKAPLVPVGDGAAPANDRAREDVFTPHERQIRERLRSAGVLSGEDASAPPHWPATPDIAPANKREYLPPHLDPIRREVEALLGAGASLDGRDLAGAELSNLDFSGRSLVGTNLKEARLCFARFAGANLTGAVLAGADLTEAALAGANLEQADLTGANLERADLTGARVAQADFSLAFGARTSFCDAQGKGARFVEGAWAQARFDRADLEAADFTRAVLDETTFDEASLPSIRLYDARGVKASFKQAKLDGARADGVSLIRSSLHGVTAASSVWDKAILDESSFFGAKLVQASFARASCRRTIFSGVDLAEGRLGRAKLTGASFLRANLMTASLESADLSGADLRGANLHGAETWKAKLGGARLDLAIVTQTKIKEKT